MPKKAKPRRKAQRRKAQPRRKAQSSSKTPRGLRARWQHLPEGLKWAVGILGAGLGTFLLAMAPGIGPKLYGDLKNYIVTALEPRCLTVETAIPEVMPLSIYHSLHEKYFPYWFRIKARNSCDETVNLTVSWKNPETDPDRPQIKFKDNTTRLYEVKPKDSEERNYNPTIRILGDEVFPDKIRLTVQWEIRDQDQKFLLGNTKEIDLLPPNRYKWDLKNPEGEDVKKEYLLAFLTNWVMTPSDKITEKINSLSTQINIRDLNDVDAFMKLLYEDIFSENNGLSYVSAPVKFPDSEMEIRTPDSVLGGGRANALDFALTLAAVAHDVVRRLEVSLVLFVIPDSDKSKKAKRFFIAWSTPQSQWKAIDISDGWKTEFDENVGATTQRLNEVLEKHPKILGAMYPPSGDHAGVYIDEKASIFGLDFKRVKKRADLNVHALPTASTRLDD